MQPIVISQTFASAISEQVSRQRIAGVLAADPRAQRVEHSETFRSGSRIRFRMWGPWGPGARQRLPALWTISSSGPSTFTLELRSDEGWYFPYLGHAPLVNHFYGKAFAHVAGRVKQALAA